MHLTPQEVDKLRLHQAGVLAQKRLARGLRLNHPEAVALIATQILEFIRDGRAVAELMDLGRRLLGHDDVLPGIADMIHEVQVEGTFPDGSKLVTVHHPIAAQQGDWALALYGSFLPVPQRPVPQRQASAPHPAQSKPGETVVPAGEVTLNEDRATVTLSITNTGDRPIQVGSHYHFIETNRALSFDREKAYGMRLNIPAGTAVRFEPGESKRVSLVAIAGKRVIQGGNNLATGEVNDANRIQAMARVHNARFLHHAEQATEVVS